MARVGETGDPALLELFQAELDTHVPVLSEGLLALEKEGPQPKRLEALMRAAHSIKGAARIVGVETAVKVSHAMEDCLVAAQKSQITLDPDGVDVLLRGVDVLTTVKEGGITEEPALTALLTALTALREGRKPAPAVKAAPVPAPVEAARLRPDSLDTKGCEKLRRELLEYRQRGVTRYQFDLGGLPEIDPAGLALLVLFARLPCLDGSPPHLEVVALSPAMRQMFHLTRLDVAYGLPSGPGV
jgi:chemotaxis protein histidine kinase CheA